jgi:hypothetical protein
MAGPSVTPQVPQRDPRVPLVPYQGGLYPQATDYTNSGTAANSLGQSISSTLETRTGLRVSPASPNVTLGYELYSTLSRAQKITIARTMDKLGYPNKTEKFLQSDLQSYFPEIYTNAKSFNDLNNQLLAQYIGKGEGPKENLPTRDINKLDRARFDTIAKDIITTKLGYEPSDAELAKEYAKYEKKNVGTVTKVEKKYNKATKQYENVRTTTPGLTEEGIQAGLEKSAMASDPDRAQRQEAFSFVGDFNKIMSGGI